MAKNQTSGFRWRIRRYEKSITENMRARVVVLNNFIEIPIVLMKEFLDGGYFLRDLSVATTYSRIYLFL